MAKAKQEILTLRIDETLKNKAQEKAQSEGESLSVAVRQLLRQWVN